MRAANLFFILLAIIAATKHIEVEAYKFLAVFPWPGHSHYMVTSSLMKALAKKGHDVTVVSPYPQKKPLKNYHDIAMPGMIKALAGDIGNLFLLHGTGFVENYIYLFDMGYRATKAALEEPTVQALIHSNETYDAVICEVFLSEALYGFSEHFNAPLIGISSLGALSWNTDMIGSPSPPSYVPHVLLPFTERMTLWERLLNLAFLTIERLHTDLVYLPRQAALYKQHFPHLQRSLYDVRKNAALMLMNQHISLSFSRPYVPNQIEVGGMHIKRKPDPLPADIQRFIDESEHGVIYFSMGSNLKSKDLPLQKRKAILDSFRELKQRVLWKFEDTNLPDKPANVFVSSWFPQDDILAQPNVLLFITHGGLLSTTESLYHGKPVIGIPIFGDQFLNMERAERHGYGIMLDYGNFSKDAFKGAIERILSVPSYTQSVRDISARYRDQPMEPLDLAVYWTEHVVRHKGADYMHCAGLDLNFIQYHNLDAIVILYGGLLVAFLLLICLFYWLLAVLCCRGDKKKQLKNKVKKH